VALFSAALELEASQRAAYLDKACADDPTLRQRLEELLRVHQEAITFLENKAPGAQQPLRGAEVTAILELPSRSAAEKPGDRIGHYKLLQQIGEGGCGVVYMAEQEEPVRRRIALKVIKLGMDTRQVIARFEAERQALALMDHPNIARVFDAGATETGRPYFVMELVRGIKITDYCDENDLSMRERLDLFVQVCQALQHAHQKGIIHRDIKPSNILVADHDGVPVPKVIDFGVAKATTDQRLTDKTLFTAFEQFIGTPAYMSPEQAKMSGLDIDTRTDIYSLGVLLYELLTGKTPLDQKELLAAGLDEMRRTIREKEPMRPSTRLSTMLEGELTTTAKHRRTDAPRLIHLLRGDLDWIVMKALEKDRARRYETANGLARDVQRYLADEPVAARPPSKLYRFQKLARRNKLAFGAAGAVVVSLIIGLAVSTWEYLKERKARQRAVAAEKAKAAEVAKATAISDLLQDMLGSGDPDFQKGPDFTVRQLLDEYSAGLTNQLADQPEVEAALRQVMGWTYYRLGVLSKAETNLLSAVALRRKAGAPQTTNTLRSQQNLARLLLTQRKWEEGAKLSLETWKDQVQLLGATNPYTLATRATYAGALLEGGQEGGQLQEAEEIQKQVLQAEEKVLGPDHFDTVCSLGTLGQILMVRGARAEAERCFTEALTRFKRTGRADVQDALTCAKELAMSRQLQGDAQQAVKLMEEAFPRAVKSLGPDHYFTLQMQRVLGRAYAEAGRLDEAEALCKEALDAQLRTKANQEGLGAARTRLYLGRVLMEKGKPAEAEPLLQDALKFFREDASSKPKPELAAQAANWLGAIQLGRQAYPEAEALMLPGSDWFFAAGAEMSPNERRLAVGHIVKLYEAWGKPEQMADWQKKLDALANPQANSLR
jgi:serine/threonine protein kinase/tetratricopeptide (TPR) repeat protein